MLGIFIWINRNVLDVFNLYFVYNTLLRFREIVYIFIKIVFLVKRLVNLGI